MSASKGVNVRQCASKDVESRKGVDWEVSHRLEKGTSASEDAGPEGGWIARSYINWRGERSILYKGVKNSP